MPANTYRTISEELIEYAEVFGRELRHRGYTVKVEQFVLGAPFTPTFRCTRTPITLFLDVAARLDLKRATAWWQFCRSCSTDTRYAIGYVESVTPKGQIKPKHEQALTKLGIGLWIFQVQGSTVERIPAQDLALTVELPPLSTLPVRLRKILAPAYEQFLAANWRECFREACDALEREARAYLWKGIRQTRITLATPRGKNRTVTRAQVDGLTLGGLATAFSQIQAPNQRDALIGQALKSSNPGRRLVAHHKGKRAAEKKLRDTVGRQMHVVIQGLRQVLE